MKNITWRKIAIILIALLVSVGCFSVGYAFGASDAATFMIDKIMEFTEYQNISIDLSRIDMIHYYRRLKGGA